MKNNSNKSLIVVMALAIFTIFCGLFGVLVIGSKNSDSVSDGGKPTTVEALASRVKYNVRDEDSWVKGNILVDTSTQLYDEMPDIEKYPLAVKGDKEIDIEIFTSGEKAGKENYAWLIDRANDFNDGDFRVNNIPVSISVRSVPSGTGADYIISNKYTPDMYSPSNTLFGEYCIANGGDLEVVADTLVGNVAGILVKNDSKYAYVEDVLNAVIAGEINLGYTNPQTSATGLNLLIELLEYYGEGDIQSQDAIDKFSKFNSNIPFVAYTTQQMLNSAKGGTLDAFVIEYQDYANDPSLKNNYKFIPFGIRHNNPLYSVNASYKTKDEKDAEELVASFLCDEDSVQLASKYGFNADVKHKDSYEADATKVVQALSIYKQYKDADKDVIAMFVADTSGSMAGDAINQLQRSLINGSSYINSNNYVGLVSYSSGVTVELPLGKFDMNQHAYFNGAVEQLSANGSTSTYEALVVAADLIQKELENHPNSKPMIFLLSDGYANGDYSLKKVSDAIAATGIPVYTIAYTADADTEELRKVASINEAASINADSEDVIYKIKSLFNSQL